MGSPSEEEGRDWYKYSFPELEGVDVEAQHRVTVPAFSMSQFPITQAQWQFVAGLPRIDRDLEPDPANFKGDDRPIEVVSWHEAMEFCARLSQFTGKTYRLPSEAEWEYAARGTKRRLYPWNDEVLDVERANFNYVYNGTSAVGCFPRGATSEGILDLGGNVWEWTRSEYQPYPYDSDDGREEGHDPVQKRFTLRGGSWSAAPLSLRATYRYYNKPGCHYNIRGFRLARYPKQ